LLGGENVDGRSKNEALLFPFMFPLTFRFEFEDPLVDGIVFTGDTALVLIFALGTRGCREFGEGFVRSGSGMRGGKDVKSKGETDTGVGRCGGGITGSGLFC
jgi:hypothetical protein